MAEADKREQAELLREKARAIYRRSDHIPLSRGDQTAIARVGELRDEADKLMRRAQELDPITYSEPL